MSAMVVSSTRKGSAAACAWSACGKANGRSRVSRRFIDVASTKERERRLVHPRIRGPGWRRVVGGVERGDHCRTVGGIEEEEGAEPRLTSRVTDQGRLSPMHDKERECHRIGRDPVLAHRM